MNPAASSHLAFGAPSQHDMAMRAPERLASLLISLVLAGCTGGSDTGEAVPPAAPGSSAAPGGAASPPSTEPTAASTGAGQRPSQPSTGPTASGKPSSGAPDAGLPEAGPPDAGLQDAAVADSGSGSGSTKMKACADKCQAAMQSCLMPSFPKDGGLPQVKDPSACQAAFEGCRTACAP